MTEEQIEATEINEPIAGVDNVALTVADRCDACGAQAYVRVGLATGELLFCLHHANENKVKLQPIAVSWHDESEKLLAR